MAISAANLVRISWTTGAYGVSQGFRFLTNVVLARLLTPELLGIMLIVNTLRTGIDLVSDVGTGQNIISNKNAEDSKFYNTAWAIQLIRGCILFVTTLAITTPLAKFYNNPLLLQVLPIAALYFLIHGASSVGPYLLQKRLQVKAISVFEVSVAAISAAAHIAFAIVTPTIWALVYGGLAWAAAYCIGSYLVMPGPRPKIRIDLEAALQLFTFGKWVFISSIVYFLSMNIDRLFLGKVVTLEVLGVYGIARSLADVFNNLINRLGNVILFPLVAASTASREELRRRLGRARLRVLLLAALVLSSFVAISDQLVYLLYDERYHAAGWMLPVLAAAIWFSLLSGLADSVLMGIGRPVHSAAANVVKLGWLAIGLPIAIGAYGIEGAVWVVAAAELARYVPLLVSQARERLFFPIQDFALSAAMAGMIGLWRLVLGAWG